MEDLPIGGIEGSKAINSNIEAAISFASKIKSTYGPRGRDKLIISKDSEITISNDGATILKLLLPKHPIGKILVQLSKTQDEQVGDGTTSIVLFTSFLLKQAKKLITNGTKIDDIINGFQKALSYLISELNPFQLPKDQKEFYHVMKKVLCVPFHSKLLLHDKDFFSDIIIRKSLNIVCIPGGSLRDSYLINAVVFKRTFSYAGYEQQPKLIKNPKILLLDHEIELKHQKEFAKISINDPKDYNRFIETEWNIVYDKIQKICETKCNVVFDSHVIGDLATQNFVKMDILNMSRIPQDTMNLIQKSTGGLIQNSLENLNEENILGTCEQYEERTIGDERYCILTGCKSEIQTLILRGSSEQILKEAERSLNDSVCVGVNILETPSFLLGGGSLEVELSTKLRNLNDELYLKDIYDSYSDALDEMVTTLCENCNIHSSNMLTSLKKIHQEKSIKNSDRYGVDIHQKIPNDIYELGIFEPANVKKNILICATETACSILQIDYIIKMPQDETEEERTKRVTDELKKRKYAEKKWKEMIQQKSQI